MTTTLPRVDQASPSWAASPARRGSTSEGSGCSSSTTIAALRILLRTTFEVVDIEVEEADSAQAAEQMIVDRAPDVVVLDVGMPGMDGLTFCRKLKADPVTADIGVVLLTGSSGGTEDAAAESGRMRSCGSPSARSSC